MKRPLFAAVLASSAAYAVQAAETREAGKASAPTPRSGIAIAYGTDPLQRLSLWPGIVAQQGGRSIDTPLIVFVHGGGWKRGSKDNATGAWKIEQYHLTVPIPNDLAKEFVAKIRSGGRAYSPSP